MNKKTAAPSRPISRQSLALSLIRAPWFSRLTDRSFLAVVIAVGIALWLYHQSSITGEQLVDIMKWSVGPWVVAHQVKDAVYGNAALQPDAPASIAAGGDVSMIPADDEMVDRPAPTSGGEDGRWSKTPLAPLNESTE